MTRFFEIDRSGSSSPLLPARHSTPTSTSPTPRLFAVSRVLSIATLLIAALALLVVTSHNGMGIVNKVIKNALWMRKGSKKPSHADSVDCSGERYRDQTLKLLDEKPIAALVPNLGHKKYEASDVTLISNDSALILADSSHDMVQVTTKTPFSHNPGANFVVRWPGKSKDSGYEALTRNETSGNFIVIKETHPRDDESLVAKMQDFRIRGREIVPGEVCFSEWTFEHHNKGFEGAAVVHGANGESYLLGLCEGNHCKGGKSGKDAGNGVIVVMRRGVDSTGQCVYETAGLVTVPAAANFQDYSSLAVRGEREIAITSQEDAAVFIGEIRPGRGEEEQLFNIATIGVYDFPRNHKCKIEYCNIEGLVFLEQNRILTVSDEMKSKGRQHHRCRPKDQSVHVFQFR